MERIDFEAAGLTRQQAEIMQAVLGVKASGEECRPSAIQAEYERFTGKSIQKPNFFTQLKHLTTTSMLVKEGGGYSVNVPALSRAFESEKKRLEREVAHFEAQQKGLKGLAASGRRPELPLIQYSSLDDYFTRIADQMGEAEVACFNSIYPWTAFSYPIARASGAFGYFTRLREFCEEGRASLKYITSFNSAYLVDLALSASKGDKKLALQECLRTLENMRSHLELYPKLEVRYAQRTLGLHFGVLKPRGSEPYNLYLFIFGKPGEVRGGVASKPGSIRNGVVINEEEMAQNVYKLFNEEFAASLDMRSPKAKKVYAQLEDQFRAALGAAR